MVTLTKVDFQNVSAGEWAAINTLNNRRTAEFLPDDPLTPLEDTIQVYRSIPPLLSTHHFLAWDEAGRPVGQASVDLLNMEENLHVAQGLLYVIPELRRQGIGRRLLGEAMACAAAEGRRVYITEGYGSTPAASAFARSFGGELGLAVRISQLDLAGLDRALLAEWLRRGERVSSEYELLFWDGPYPQEWLEEMVTLNQAMNQAPRGDLEVEDISFSPEVLRQLEQSLFERGYTRWTYAVRQRETNRLAGFTDTLWKPSKPVLLMQGNTGVLASNRGRGLGRWLKAAMLQKALEERPQARFVRTSNAASNAPMLKINAELGFRPYAVSENYQFDIPATLERLGL